MSDTTVEILEFPAEGGFGSTNAESINHHTDHPLAPNSALNMSTEDLVGVVANFTTMRMHGFEEFLIKGDEASLPREIIEKVRIFEKGMDDLKNEVSSSDAVEKLRKISGKFQRADDGQIPENLEDLRRGKRRIIFDFDGTISDPNHRGGARHDRLLAGSDPLDDYIGDDRSKFKYAAAEWVDLMNSHPEIFEAGGREVPLRDGMIELLEDLLSDKNCNITILTTNFNPFMKAVMSRIKGSEKIQLLCMQDDDMTSFVKGDVVKKIALDNPDEEIEYVGDGGSDFPALEARSVVGAYHTASGMSFDKKMDEETLAHLPFDNVVQLRQNLGVLPKAA